jgi:lipid-binding SYLF domain-containing protein
MSRTMLRLAFSIAAAALCSSSLTVIGAQDIDQEARRALASLTAKVDAAKALAAKANAILVFPEVKKAGFGIGGQHGDGILIKNGKTVAHYQTTGASFGLQAGAQTYGYALFFMNEKALQQLDKADGFEVGVGPSVVVVDEGMARSATTTTMNQDIYAFIFGQKGLMAGLGIQGNRIKKRQRRVVRRLATRTRA